MGDLHVPPAVGAPPHYVDQPLVAHYAHAEPGVPGSGRAAGSAVRAQCQLMTSHKSHKLLSLRQHIVLLQLLIANYPTPKRQSLKGKNFSFIDRNNDDMRTEIIKNNSRNIDETTHVFFGEGRKRDNWTNTHRRLGRKYDERTKAQGGKKGTDGRTH